MKRHQKPHSKRLYEFFGNKGELGVFGIAGSRGISSSGRAPDLHSGGGWFESSILHQPRSISVAVNTSPCHGEDHGFDSRMLSNTVGASVSICSFA